MSDIKDWGADPLGEGKYRMVPSGDVVDLAEKEKRLGAYRRKTAPVNDCLGLSWSQIEAAPGGKLKHK